MFEIELVKVNHDDIITFSSVPVNGSAFTSLYRATKAARQEAADWYNHEYDYVLVNDIETGALMHQFGIEWNHDGTEKFITLDHYDWSSGINNSLTAAIENVGVSAEIESFCYTDGYNNLVRPFEPVGGKTKRVNKETYLKMLNDLQEFFEKGLEEMKKEDL